LLCKVFRENKKLDVELESVSSQIISLRSVHDDMSVKPCDNYNMIMISYADLWLMHHRTRLELRELKARSMLLGACTPCPFLRSNLEAYALEIKYLKHRFAHSSRYSVLSPPCDACGSLKGKLFHATKENIELKQEVAYLTTLLEKTKLSEKMIEDLSRVEESATKSTYRLGVGFERYEDKGEKSATKFIPSSSYHKEEATIKPIKAHYPSNPNREARKETHKVREEAFICIFCGRVSHLDEFYFQRKRIERRRFEYARNSYCDEFFKFLPHSYSRTSPRTSSHALPQFAHGPNHHSYGSGS
jgi:hypothetical protein